MAATDQKPRGFAESFATRDVGFAIGVTLVLAMLFGKATAPAYDIDGDGRINHYDLIALIRVLTSR